MKSLDIYEYADKSAEYLSKQYVRQFGKYDNIMKFDALNIIKKSKKLYEWLDKVTRETLLMLANVVYTHYVDGDSVEEAWLTGFLNDYDAVTKYVYTSEWERKRQRYAESMIAGGTYKEQAIALHLLLRQAAQYTINVADAAQIKAYKKLGVKRVMWVTENDDKVCKTCESRNGIIYPINNIPPKPHPNCRCRFVPMEE